MIAFHKLNENAILPTRANKLDAGLDLYSTVDVIIAPNQWAKISTGLRIDIPENYYGQVCSRSGLALKLGLIVHQGVGVIDCGYEGELQVMLRNVSDTTQTVKYGDRIAQLLICPVAIDEAVMAYESQSSLSTRGAGGFGSSGS